MSHANSKYDNISWICLLTVISVFSFWFGILIASNQMEGYYVKRLKKAGLAYYNIQTGELLINLPE